MGRRDDAAKATSSHVGGKTCGVFVLFYFFPKVALNKKKVDGRQVETWREIYEWGRTLNSAIFCQKLPR